MIRTIMVILLIIQLIAAFPMYWTGVIAVVGLLKKKKPAPSAGPKNRFAVIVCARNEEKVLPGLFRSLEALDYPRRLWHVYLVADHCTDGTVACAKKFPFVTVIERTEGTSSGKGDALSFGLKQVYRQAGDTFDAVMVFDADNTADPGIMKRINACLESGESIVQGYRTAGRPFRSIITGWYALYWHFYSYFYSYARDNLGLSCFLTGTGFAFRKEILDEAGWNTVSITEDVEFSIQNCLRGKRVAFSEDARCSDEQPWKLSQMFHQLTRWCTGNYQIISAYRKDILASKKPVRLRALDNYFLLFVGPSSIVLTLGMIAFIVLSALSGSRMMLTTSLAMPALGYLACSLGSLAMALYCRLPLKEVWRSILTFQVFLWIYTFCSFWALIHPTKSWHAIEHHGLTEARGNSRGK